LAFPIANSCSVISPSPRCRSHLRLYDCYSLERSKVPSATVRSAVLRFVTVTLSIGVCVVGLAPFSANAVTAPQKHYTKLSPHNWVAATSTQWAGFVVPGLANYRFHAVTTLTAVPTAHCSAGENSLVDVWAGLGGTGSNVSLVQAGIALRCRNGRPGYDAWAEWYDPKRGNHELVQRGFHVAPGAN